MTVYVIDLPQTDGQAFQRSAVLSGVRYRMDFYFNERDLSWSISLFDSGGDEIANGMACRLEFDLFAVIADVRKPTGLLMLTDTGGQYIPAGRNDLGARVQLIYDDLINV